MEKQRSAFSINIVELLIAVGFIILVRISLHAALWSSYPVGYDLILRLPLSDFIKTGREEIFRTWVLPISIIIALSSIFLVRGIANQDIQSFSRLSHFALASPLLVFSSITYLYFIGLYCLPIGLVLSFLSIVESIKSQKWWGSILAVVWNVACVIVAGYYFGHIDYVFGD